jgi:anaerobic selenocysteine-containing dehydrogenase
MRIRTRATQPRRSRNPPPTSSTATWVRIASPHGQIELPTIVTKDIVAGVVAVPHGWGHKGTGGWRLAKRAGGANVNRLMSSAPEDLEKLAGMARLTGVPVRVSRS